MEEGERLSKKQLTQESTIKKLRAAAKEAVTEKAGLEAQIAELRDQAASNNVQLEQANTALQVTSCCKPTLTACRTVQVFQC